MKSQPWNGLLVEDYTGNPVKQPHYAQPRAGYYGALGGAQLQPQMQQQDDTQPSDMELHGVAKTMQYILDHPDQSLSVPEILRTCPHVCRRRVPLDGVGEADLWTLMDSTGDYSPGRSQSINRDLSPQKQQQQQLLSQQQRQIGVRPPQQRGSITGLRGTMPGIGGVGPLRSTSTLTSKLATPTANRLYNTRTCGQYQTH